MSRLIVLLLWILAASLARAGDVTLAWDPNPEQDLAGYKLYYGNASRSYSQALALGNVTTYTVTGLASGTYYFAVTAYNVAQLESGFSNEVSKTFALSLLTITSQAVSLRWFGVVVQCTTSVNASTVLRYRKIGAPVESTVATIVTTEHAKALHVAVLYLANEDAFWTYEWEASDAQGNIKKTSGTFQTRQQ
jgi:hypothetical protein